MRPYGRGMGESPFDLFTRSLQELKAGVAKPAGVSPKSTINWWCWAHPGFQDCHKLSFQAAQLQCANAGRPDEEACLVETSDRLSKEGCPCPDAPPPTGMSDSTKKTIGFLVLGGVVVWAMWPDKKKGS